MNIAALILPVFTAVVVSSCASVSVREEQRGGRQPVQRPSRIYVADFATVQGQYKIQGDAGKDPEAFKRKTAGTLTNYLVKGISEHVAPATSVQRSNLPSSGWLVAGEFVRVNTGSRLLRSGVGLGAGGTKMETRVEIYDLSTRTTNVRPFMTFETTGGSNAMPGLLTSTGPGSAAFSMMTQAMMGVTDDVARTSRMITGALNGYFIDRGWLDKSKAYSAKRPGKYRLVHENYTR